MERRVLTHEIKLETRVGTDNPYIVGYGAVYHREDDPGTEFDIFGDGSLIERVMPGAFDRAIRDMDVVGLYNHDPNHVLGRTSAATMKLRTTDIGLQYEITPPDTQLGRDLMASIKRGDIKGSSFSFLPRKVSHGADRSRPGTTIRELHDVDLFDVGPVTFPAYAGTTSGMRAVGDDRELRDRLMAEAKEVLRDAGLWRVLAAARARALEVELGMDYRMDPRPGGFSDNNTTEEPEPSWGRVNQSKLPYAAFAQVGNVDDPSTWRYAHHHVVDGTEPDLHGRVSRGTMYLHREGLQAAYKQADEDGADEATMRHLERHLRALGLPCGGQDA
jgi:uncharacterized protein